MRVQSNEEFLESLDQAWYDSALPFGRFFINYYRRKEGRPPLHRSF